MSKNNLTTIQSNFNFNASTFSKKKSCINKKTMDTYLKQYACTATCDLEKN